MPLTDVDSCVTESGRMLGRMSHNEEQYLQLCRHVLEQGRDKNDRTQTGTRSVFGYQMRFDLSEGFPLLTTKKLSFRQIASELLWFIKGDTNIRYLLQHKNNIWNEWAFKKWVESSEYAGPDMHDFGRRVTVDTDFAEVYKAQMASFKARVLEDDAFAAKYGELGNVYGKQWRRWQTADGETIDQLQDVLALIKHDPDSRRMIVNSWSPEDVHPSRSALPPCHTLFQFYVADGRLSCQMYQRSADIFLGVPYNIASYALLLQMIAQVCDLQPGEFVHTLGDAHLYQNHLEQVAQQLARQPRPLPKLMLNPDISSLFDFEMQDLQIENYDPHPAIRAFIAV